MHALPLPLPYPQLYDLYGVLVHHGHSVNSGHYICYVKAANGLWHLADDHRVTSVGEKVREGRQWTGLKYGDVRTGRGTSVGEKVGEGRERRNKARGGCSCKAVGSRWWARRWAGLQGIGAGAPPCTRS